MLVRASKPGAGIRIESYTARQQAPSRTRLGVLTVTKSRLRYNAKQNSLMNYVTALRRHKQLNGSLL